MLWPLALGYVKRKLFLTPVAKRPIPALHVYQLLRVHKFIHHRHKLHAAFTDYFSVKSFIGSHITRINNKYSCREETVALLRGSVLDTI